MISGLISVCSSSWTDLDNDFNEKIIFNGGLVVFTVTSLCFFKPQVVLISLQLLCFLELMRLMILLVRKGTCERGTWLLDGQEKNSQSWDFSRDNVLNLTRA